MSGEPILSWVTSTNDVEVPIYDLGGDGETLLVGHATGFHGRVYDRLLERLEPFRRVTADLRGHGRARTPADLDYSWESFAADLGAVLTALDPEGPILGFGHSMGAACLLMLEQQRPGSFHALYCYEPVIYPPSVAVDAARLELFADRARRRRAEFESLEAALENFRAKPPCDRFDAGALRDYVEHGFERAENGAVRLRCRPEVEAQIYLMGAHHRTFERLGEVRCPVRLARGELLQPGPGEWIEEIARELPSAELAILPQIGHLGPLEDPAAVASDVARFFSSY